jgi:hypothetical protein
MRTRLPVARATGLFSCAPCRRGWQSDRFTSGNRQNFGSTVKALSSAPSFPRSAWERTDCRSAARCEAFGAYRPAPQSGNAGIPTESVGTRKRRDRGLEQGSDRRGRPDVAATAAFSRAAANLLFAVANDILLPTAIRPADDSRVQPCSFVSPVPPASACCASTSSLPDAARNVPVVRRA